LLLSGHLRKGHGAEQLPAIPLVERDEDCRGQPPRQLPVTLKTRLGGFELDDVATGQVRLLSPTILSVSIRDTHDSKAA
jgi:hypothetical protein